jgi:hypothetical protein
MDVNDTEIEDIRRMEKKVHDCMKKNGVENPSEVFRVVDARQDQIHLTGHKEMVISCIDSHIYSMSGNTILFFEEHVKPLVLKHQDSEK